MAAKIRVLTVDDSATARSILSGHLAADPEIEVIGSARDGVEALSKIITLRPDVVTLDVEMPRMDGLRTLNHIMKHNPTAVIMVSALTEEGADITVRALQLGAIDFVCKLTRGGVPALHEAMNDLRSKVKLAARANVLASLPAARESKVPRRIKRPWKSTSVWQDSAVVIASSTGGPQALSCVLSSLPADTTVPILVVQHMPALFTHSLAERLNELSPLRVEEAQPGSRVADGQVLIAPGNQHMTITDGGEIHLSPGAKECGVRPSANVTMESVVRAYGASTVGVILTGMGSDGTRGAGLIKAAGGKVIAQDEASSVVYGMPKSVVDAGYVDRVVPLPRIASAVVSMCQARPRHVEAGV
jgi:two-component system chemotaxis response regulator CheB